jgi:hypothetical protein
MFLPVKFFHRSYHFQHAFIRVNGQSNGHTVQRRYPPLERLSITHEAASEAVRTGSS